MKLRKAKKEEDAATAPAAEDDAAKTAAANSRLRRGEQMSFCFCFVFVFVAVVLRRGSHRNCARFSFFDFELRNGRHLGVMPGVSFCRITPPAL